MREREREEEEEIVCGRETERNKSSFKLNLWKRDKRKEEPEHV